MRDILYTGLFFEDSDLKLLSELRKDLMKCYRVHDEGKSLDEFHCTLQYKPTDITETLSYKSLGELKLDLLWYGSNQLNCIAVHGVLNGGDSSKVFHITMWCDKNAHPVQSNSIRNLKRLSPPITLHPYLGYMSYNKWIVRL